MGELIEFTEEIMILILFSRYFIYTVFFMKQGMEILKIL